MKPPPRRLIVLMRHRPSKLAATTSLVLAIAIGAVWVRSHWLNDRFAVWNNSTRERTHQGWVCSGWSQHGRLLLHFYHFSEPGLSDPELQTRARGGGRRFETSRPYIPSFFIHSLTGRFGFKVVWDRDATAGRTQFFRRLCVPHWFLAFICLVLPVHSLLRLVTRPRTGPNLCATCGYDLRATPDWCPECGNRAARESE